MVRKCSSILQIGNITALENWSLQYNLIQKVKTYNLICIKWYNK